MKEFKIDHFTLQLIRFLNRYLGLFQIIQIIYNTCNANIFWVYMGSCFGGGKEICV